MTVTRLETERLILRAPAPRDAEAYIAFFGSDRAASIGGPQTRAEAWVNFATELGHWGLRGYGMFTLTHQGSDDAVGLIGPWNPEGWPETEIGWLIFDARLEGKGYAHEAARACVDHAWHTLNWPSVVSYIGAGNTRSIALAQRLGAQLDETAAKPGDWAQVWRHPKPSQVAA